MKIILKPILQYLFGSILYLLSFFTLYYIKNSNLYLNQLYAIFLIIILLSWLTASLIVGKYRGRALKRSVHSLQSAVSSQQLTVGSPPLRVNWQSAPANKFGADSRFSFAEDIASEDKPLSREMSSSISRGPFIHSPKGQASPQGAYIHTPIHPFKQLFIAFFLMLGLLALFSQFYNLTTVSRYIIVGSLLLGLILETIFTKILYRNSRTREAAVHLNISLIPIITEIVTLIYTVSLIFIFGLNYKSLSEVEILLLVGLFISWLISSLFSHRFEFNTKENYWRLIWRYIKSYIIFGALVTFLLFILRMDFRVSIYLMVSVVIFATLSWLILTFIYISRRPVKVDEVKTRLIKATEVLEDRVINRNGKVHGKYRIEGNMYSPYLAGQLSDIYLKRFPDVYKFLEEKIDLLSFDFRKCVMLRSADTYNVEVLPDNALELYMNLHEINNIRRINYYLIHVNSKLETGGLFIGCLQPNILRFRQFLDRYPVYLARLFYFIDFLWKRVSPKLPVVKKFYFALTKGKNRALSLAEGLGRFYYCGFEIIGLKKIGSFIYFIAKKSKIPSEDKDPSYGLFIKLKRVGKGGKVINVYKLRTMHPYSEYLQQFVYDMNELEEGGKLKDDFRITGWGKVMRKLWLDEMPMYINVFKRELKLVGIRPLSRHYYNLYREDLRERRKNYKPGLVPPFYVDLPKTLDDIMKSEEKYLDAYDKSPVITDIRYFFKAWYNILVKRARSG